MLGFIIGTVCLVALVKMARHGACGGYALAGGCHGGGCHGGGWHGRHRWHGHHRFDHDHGHGDHQGRYDGPGPWMFTRFALRKIFERLDTTPGQEKVILQVADELQTALREAGGTLRSSRDDLAKSIRGESLDESSLGSAFAHQDEAVSALRKSVTHALGKLHEALTPRQREILADLIAEGPRGWGRFAGPYRS
jgi:Spy/CpxP family protein refolding chaperone